MLSVEFHDLITLRNAFLVTLLKFLNSDGIAPNKAVRAFVSPQLVCLIHQEISFVSGAVYFELITGVQQDGFFVKIGFAIDVYDMPVNFPRSIFVFHHDKVQGVITGEERTLHD